jgi:hypothetical protein
VIEQAEVSVDRPRNSGELEDAVRLFLHDKLNGDTDSIVTCQSLSAMFLDEHVSAYGPLGGWNVAAYIGVAQTIRPMLRKHYGEEPDDTQIDLNLPEVKLLQDRYSVPCAGPDGEAAYVPRHKLTKDWMEKVVARDRAISTHYARRADALESWWYRNNQGSTV